MSNVPLEVHEVLEEEYVSMYGPLPVSGDPKPEARLENVYNAVHQRAREGKPRTALCISGGGIRSATFGLGIIQGLARSKVLEKFDYLSTVSGGGYIGSWLSSWIRRDDRGVSGVQDALICADNAFVGGSPKVPEHKIDPEPEPLRHLREYSNYLSPRLGLFSGDTWTLASLYVRNLLLNLLVLVPILACALAVPRMFSYLLEFSKDHETWIAPGRWAWIAAAFGTFGFAYLGWTRPVEQGQAGERKGTATSDGRFILFCVFPLTLASAALCVFWARAQAHPGLLTDPLTLRAAALAVIGITVVPFLLYYSRLWTSLPAERRTSFEAKKEFRRAQMRKLFAEGVAMLVALGTTGALLWLLAKKVFDQPVLDVPLTATLPPVERLGAVSAPHAQLFLCFAIPLLLLVFFVQASIFVGLSSKRNEDYDREWWGRAGAWLIAFAVGLGVFGGLAVFGPIAFYYAPAIIASVGGLAAVASALLGYSDKTPGTDKNVPSKLSSIASALAVPLFIGALLASISLGTTWIAQQFETSDPISKQQKYVEKTIYQARYTTTEQTAKGPQQLIRGPEARLGMPALMTIAHLQTVQRTTLPQVIIFFGIALFGGVLSCFIGVNKFSMQALYRNRLIRAYLGASRWRRDPDRFTGFDPNDNLQMWELRPELVWAKSFRDFDAFTKALQGKGKLADYVWQNLEDGTREAITSGVPIAQDALVQNLNRMILKGDLSASGAEPAEWAKSKPNTRGYSTPVCNRAMLDKHFADTLVPMAPPADADGAPRPDFARAPLHVVNTTLNLTGGENLAWQQRMAEAMSISAYHAGSFRLGYRPSNEYGGPDGISLGTAVAISGAAANPNMGFSSSPTMAFLLTFFNIRLGAWMGNPGPRGETSYRNTHPTSGLVPMFQELTGNSNDQSKWVNLSDGGHFENLGLYEMVLRRCHTIVLSDGGCDPKCTFDDLGNAIRKIRTDFGVPVDIIGKIEMFPRAADGKPVEGQYVAIGRIRYTVIDKNGVDGILVYIKPGIYKSDYFPRDVYNYAQQSMDFPHESTNDQFFSESQFESYRMLGRHVINEITGAYAQLGGAAYSNIAAFADLIEKRLESWVRLRPEEVVAASVDRVALAISNAGTVTGTPGSVAPSILNASSDSPQVPRR